MLKFTKMQSLGNDFMIIDGVTQAVTLTNRQVQQWADRHTGIGFDQCLVIENGHNPGIDFFLRIFNADGSEVAQCGNGMRCIARFAVRQGLTPKAVFKLATHTTTMTADVTHQEAVKIVFESPCFLGQKQLSDPPVTLSLIEVGNPHAVCWMQDFQNLEVAVLGKQISEHPTFPLQTNVEFVMPLSAQRLAVRVYERGCGETMACGSGAVAAAVIAMHERHMPLTLTVVLPGGPLEVDWSQPDTGIALTGPADFVYEGSI